MHQTEDYLSVEFEYGLKLQKLDESIKSAG